MTNILQEAQRLTSPVLHQKKIGQPRVHLNADPQRNPLTRKTNQREKKMSQIPQVASTQGSPSFDPDAFFDAWAQETLTPPYDNDFRKFIIKAFGLRGDDSFVYRAVAEVTLLQAQTYLEFGGQGGLHGWYRDGEGKEVSLVFSSCCSVIVTCTCMDDPESMRNGIVAPNQSREMREEAIRRTGNSLIRSISNIPYSHLSHLPPKKITNPSKDQPQ
jgi:hypothetical protein